MDRDEFMELVYETFADEPDNVLANGIIEAADAYAEHEKAQLSQEGTTKDTISRQAALEKVRTMQTYKLFMGDDMILVDKAEVQTELMMLPTVQPEVLACGSGELVAQPEPQHGRVFKGIVVEYPSYNTYPEYKGKPYFLIKYTEKGQSFIGYGTYNPEVLSEYLKEYFIPSAQPETAKRIVGKSRDGMALWYQCDMCNEPVDEQDNYCRGCGRRLIDG